MSNPMPPTRSGLIPAGIGYTSYQDGIKRFTRTPDDKPVEIYQALGGWAYWYEVSPTPPHFKYQCKVRFDLVNYEDNDNAGILPTEG